MFYLFTYLLVSLFYCLLYEARQRRASLVSFTSGVEDPMRDYEENTISVGFTVKVQHLQG